MRLGVVLFALAVLPVTAGCAGQPASISLPPRIACLPLRTWSAAEQDQLRKEYDALPAPAKMRAAFQDYVAMRDEDRACLANSVPSVRYLH
ncbi:MAG: hypothetical protein ACLQUZ_12815 [Rhizomicrobium sp.]